MYSISTEFSIYFAKLYKNNSVEHRDGCCMASQRDIAAARLCKEWISMFYFSRATYASFYFKYGKYSLFRSEKTNSPFGSENFCIRLKKVLIFDFAPNAKNRPFNFDDDFFFHITI